MPKNWISFLLFFIATTAFVASCSQPDVNYGGVGGGLPTKYITILSDRVKPANLTVSVGSTITFLNQSTSNQTIVADNFSLLASPTLIPGGYYFFNKTYQDTIIYFHSIEHPNLTGTITLRP